MSLEKLGYAPGLAFLGRVSVLLIRTLGSGLRPHRSGAPWLHTVLPRTLAPARTLHRRGWSNLNGMHNMRELQVTFRLII